MSFIEYREGQLYVEKVQALEIARQIETPVYCYSAAALRHNYQRYAEQFKPANSLICFAVKA